MKRSRIFILGASLPLLLIIALACSFGAAAGDPSATETAIAVVVMTQIAPTPNLQSPITNPPGTPPVNPFQNLTADQESCLRQAWGDEAFTAIATFQRPPSPDEAPAMGKCGLATPPGAPPAGTGGPGQPGGTPGAGGPVGPPQAFTDQTYVATSTDGLTWSAGTLLAEQASVPEVIYTSQGVFWAYWVDFSSATGPGTEKISVARSSDGVTWEKLGTANFGDIGGIVPVDPDALELPDGRMRLYFYDIAQSQGPHPIYSAASSDGINFTLEPGARFSHDNIFDPNVIQLPDGRFRMYLNMRDIISATSNDGLTFTADEGVRIEKGSVPGAIVLPDGSVRLYACASGISVYHSADGLTFDLEKRDVIRPPSGPGILCDPSVTASPNGYVMVYKYNSGK